MSEYWYSIPHLKETGNYRMADGINNFPRGVYLAYSDCCLVTGCKSKEEAESCFEKYPCKKFAEAPDAKE